MRPEVGSPAKTLLEQAADLMSQASREHVPDLSDNLQSRAYWGIILEDTLDRLHEAIRRRKDRSTP